jgi:hypothetical protein
MSSTDAKTEIMVSSNPKPPENSQLYCPIRKKWVARLPEEHVRQHLVKYMVDKLEFPLGSLALEKELRHMPHLALHPGKIPERRADLICFAKGIHPEYDLYPLLLVECKAVKLTPKVIAQVTGYNHFLGAFFVGIANHEEVKIGWLDQKTKKYQFISHLPNYQELLKAVVSSNHA